MAVHQELRSGAETVAAVLRRIGTSMVFAYPGTSELGLCAAVEDSGSIALANARGDREAVFMAAGGNLVHGATACAAILHGARGLTNAVGAIADLRRNEIPVLCIVGMPSRSSARYLPPHGELGLIENAGRFSKSTIDCSLLEGLDPTEFLELVMAAVRALEELPPGPILLGLPHDLLSAKFVPFDVLAGLRRTPPRRVKPNIADAAATIDSSKRPVVLIDDYLLKSPTAEQDIAAFSARLTAPVFQLAYQRGPMLFRQIRPEAVPDYLGLYDPNSRSHRAVLGSADLLITLEDRNMYRRVVGRLPNCRKIAITSNAASTLKNGYLDGPADILLSGDVCETIRRIVPQLTDRRHDVQQERSLSSPTDTPSCRPSAVELARSIGTGLGRAKARFLVDDSQMLGGLLARNYRFLPSSINVFGSHGGFVGGGLPTAAGVAIASPDVPVLATLGDQGFTNGVQALAAIEEHCTRLAVLVCNNGGSVSLQAQSDFELTNTVGRRFLENVAWTSYANIARGFGLSAVTLHWPQETGMSAAVVAARHQLATELEHALMSDRPHLVEVIAPNQPEFWSGIWRVKGNEDAPLPITSPAH